MDTPTPPPARDDLDSTGDDDFVGDRDAADDAATHTGTARAVFDVTSTGGETWPEGGTPGAQLGRLRVHKSYREDLVGSSVTEGVTAVGAVAGSATYTAIEAFTGSVHGRTGSFVFTHSSTVRGGEIVDRHSIVVPDCATGELTGIGGSGVIDIDGNGTHHLTLRYTLPTTNQPAGD
jgi:hypothetical protein